MKGNEMLDGRQTGSLRLQQKDFIALAPVVVDIDLRRSASSWAFLSSSSSLFSTWLNSVS
jgi:hypothetical protein